MTKTASEIHQECVNRFIDLANTMKDEGVDTNVVSAGLMSASGVYASYLAAGNDGGLTASGVEKVAAAYKRELERIEKIKKDNKGVV
jgi:hypothetical protein